MIIQCVKRFGLGGEWQASLRKDRHRQKGARKGSGDRLIQSSREEDLSERFLTFANYIFMYNSKSYNSSIIQEGWEMVKELLSNRQLSK